MEDKDWIFEKWPIWLRWICALPLAVLGSMILPLLSRFGLAYIGYDLNSGLGKTIIQYASLAGFLAIIYTCVPKFKKIITGIMSILFSILFAISTYLYIIQDSWFNWEFFIIVLSFISCLIFAIFMFILHGEELKQSAINSIYNYELNQFNNELSSNLEENEE